MYSVTFLSKLPFNMKYLIIKFEKAYNNSFYIFKTKFLNNYLTNNLMSKHNIFLYVFKYLFNYYGKKT